MGALLYNFAIFQDDDVVRIHDRAEAVSHNDQGFASEIFVEVLHDDHLVEYIQRCSGFVEEEIIRVFVHRPGNVQALFLALAQAQSFGANFGIVAHRQSLDETLNIGHFDRTQ